MVLVSSISNFFSNKISRANKWMMKKIPTCSNSALDAYVVSCPTQTKNLKRTLMEIYGLRITQLNMVKGGSLLQNCL